MLEESCYTHTRGQRVKAFLFPFPSAFLSFCFPKDKTLYCWFFSPFRKRRTIGFLPRSGKDMEVLAIFERRKAKSAETTRCAALRDEVFERIYCISPLLLNSSLFFILSPSSFVSLHIICCCSLFLSLSLSCLFLSVCENRSGSFRSRLSLSRSR